MTNKLQHHDGIVVTYQDQDLATVPTETLRGELSRMLTITADHLVYLAAIWRELERRGEDLSDLRSGLAVYFPMIASRHLDAEAVVRFAGNRSVLSAVATLPMDEQRRLAKGGTVPVVFAHDDGQYITQKIPAAHLKPAQVKLVFDAGRIRTISEQQTLVEPTQQQAQKRTVPVKLSGEEHRALKIMAAETGKTIPEVILDGLRSAGMIK